MPLWQSIDDSYNPFRHEGLTEVQYVPQSHAREPQVCEQLFLVRIADFFDTLEFYNQLSFDEYVCAKTFVESVSTIFDGDGNLPFGSQPSLSQFMY
jgi:hypothetical protein